MKHTNFQFFELKCSNFCHGSKLFKRSCTISSHRPKQSLPSAQLHIRWKHHKMEAPAILTEKSHEKEPVVSI